MRGQEYCNVKLSHPSIHPTLYRHSMQAFGPFSIHNSSVGLLDKFCLSNIQLQWPFRTMPNRFYFFVSNTVLVLFCTLTQTTKNKRTQMHFAINSHLLHNPGMFLSTSAIKRLLLLLWALTAYINTTTSIQPPDSACHWTRPYHIKTIVNTSLS